MRAELIRLLLLGFLLLGAPLQVSGADEPVFFDFESFLGERIRLQGTHSPLVDNLRLNIILPPDYKIFTDAGPFLYVFSPEANWEKTFDIKDIQSIFSVKEKIAARDLYAQLTLYYCQYGKESICIMKNILYEIPLRAGKEEGDVTLNYVVHPYLTAPKENE